MNKVVASDIRRAAVHEAAHAILAIHNGWSAQIRIFPADHGLDDPALSTVVAQCGYGSSGRTIGKIRHAAFGLAGFCAEHIYDECLGDFSDGPDDIGYWTSEIQCLLEEGAAMSSTDQSAWQGLQKCARRKAVRLAVATILKEWPEIERVVTEAEAHFDVRGYATFNWPLGPFDKVK